MPSIACIQWEWGDRRLNRTAGWMNKLWFDYSRMKNIRIVLNVDVHTPSKATLIHVVQIYSWFGGGPGIMRNSNLFRLFQVLTLRIPCSACLPHPGTWAYGGMLHIYFWWWSRWWSDDSAHSANAEVKRIPWSTTTPPWLNISIS